MEKFDKKIDFKRESDYAGEELRIAEILRTELSEEEVSRIVFEIEKIAKETDEVVGEILSHPKIIERYEVEPYDGLELHPRPPVKTPIHFMRDGLWELRHLDKNNLLTVTFFDEDGSYRSDLLLEWLGDNLKFNQMRLRELEESGNISITDPTKVRIVRLKPDDKNNSEEENPILH